MEDPAFVQRRQERAYDIARWANTREYIHRPNASDGEEDEFEEEQVEDSAGDEGAADSEAGSEEEEAVDESIEVDQAPARTTTSPADTTDEPLKLAAEIGAKAAAEISALEIGRSHV